jgi:uncharacterized membrane protein YidH (DUF202 family)
MAYGNRENDELILRDELALERTKLANERTFLAYARTAIMLGISGGTVLKLFATSTAMIAKRFFSKTRVLDSVSRS